MSDVQVAADLIEQGGVEAFSALVTELMRRQVLPFITASMTVCENQVTLKAEMRGYMVDGKVFVPITEALQAVDDECERRQ